MQTSQSNDSFFAANKKLVQDYLNIRVRIMKLKATQLFAKVAGNVAWLLVFLFLVFLLAIFIGLATGFWLSSLTGSYTTGFALTGLIILGLVLLLVALRKTLFINPIIRAVIRSMDENKTDGSLN
jgi:hypothetical protein